MQPSSPSSHYQFKDGGAKVHQSSCGTSLQDPPAISTSAPRLRSLADKSSEMQLQGVSIEEDFHSPPLENEESVAAPIDELDLNPADLEQIALIYDQIRALYRTRSKGKAADKRLASEFDAHLKTVMLNLSNALRS